MAMGMSLLASRSVATLIVAADGSGDFTTVQAALAALPASGGAIYVKEGTYSVSETITIDKDDVSIIGTGPSSIISQTADTTAFSSNTHYRLTLKDLAIVGTYVNPSSSSGISFDNCSQVKLEGLYLSNFGYVCIRLNTCAYSRILNCRLVPFTAGGISVEGETENTLIFGNEIYESEGDACSLDTTGLNIIANNTFRDCVYSGLYLSQSSGNLIVGNLFRANTAAGITLSQSSRNHIIGNIFDANETYGVAILDEYCDGNYIAPNLFINTSSGEVDDAGVNTERSFAPSAYVLKSGSITQIDERSHTDLSNIGTKTHDELDAHFSDSNAHTWANIDKTTSDIADITTKSHTSLTDTGTNTHAQIDTFISSKAAASGLASLDAASLVVQNPANATATPTASKIPIANASGDLADGWLTSNVPLLNQANAFSANSASNILDATQSGAGWAGHFNTSSNNYVKLANGAASAETAYFYRNLAAASTSAAVVKMKNDHADDDQRTLEVVHDTESIEGALFYRDHPNEQFKVLSSRTGGDATFFFYRNLASAATSNAVVAIQNANSGDDQPTLFISNSAAGAAGIRSTQIGAGGHFAYIDITNAIPFLAIYRLSGTNRNGITSYVAGPDTSTRTTAITSQFEALCDMPANNTLTTRYAFNASSKTGAGTVTNSYFAYIGADFISATSIGTYQKRVAVDTPDGVRYIPLYS